MKASEPVQHELFATPRPDPEEIIAQAFAHNPIKVFALFSGGDDSLVTVDWMMENVPGCEVLHIITGTGIPATREFVRDTCRSRGWPLTEISAPDDCGQHYEQIVMEHGFPGPAGHRFMYAQLKERCIEEIMRRVKDGRARTSKVMFATGIRNDESERRAGYGGKEVNFRWAQEWVNPFYWVDSGDFVRYRTERGLRRNPVSEILGMSGECLCGAFAGPGELSLVRLADPQHAAWLEDLDRRVRAKHGWGWEQRPPKRCPIDSDSGDMFGPMCNNCLKRPERKS